MRERISRNIGLKVLSVIIAIMLWLVIVNIDDPVISERFLDVPVSIINDEVVLERGQVYDVIQGETVDFTVEARRSIVERLRIKHFKVIADFNLISSYDTIQINISSPEFGDRIRIVEGKYPMMKISREESMEQNFKVDVIERGNVAGGYHIVEKTASPNIISVIGPKARVESVASIAVEVDVTGAAESFSIKAVPKALDAEGNQINDLKLVLSEDEVNVKVKLFQTKIINLVISKIGEPLEGYKMTSIEYEPKTIVIAGNSDEFKELKYLPINESIVDAVSNIEKEIDIQEQLPEGIYVVGEPVAVIKINIEKIKTKNISIFPSDLKVRNKSSSTVMQYTNSLPINLVISGVEEELKDITVEDIKPYIDLNDVNTVLSKQNVFSMPINIMPNRDIKLSNTASVEIRITK